MITHEITGYISCCGHTIPDKYSKGRNAASSFGGRVHYSGEVRVAGAWASWSHCVHNQEAEGDENVSTQQDPSQWNGASIISTFIN